MYSNWTVFLNLTIGTLLCAAGYIGTGESSVFATYRAANPVVVNVPAVTIAPAASAQATVALESSGSEPMVLATYSPATLATASVAEPVAAIVSPVIALTASVTGEAVNLRLGPSTDFDKIGTVVFGETLVLTGKRDGSWVQVRHPVDNSPVWISEKFIN